MTTRHPTTAEKTKRELEELQEENKRLRKELAEARKAVPTDYEELKKAKHEREWREARGLP